MNFMAFFIPTMNSICFNGDYYLENQPFLLAQNRGFRYGDGLFETMKVFKGNVVLKQYHFDRLFFGLDLLKIKADDIHQNEILRRISDLCIRNACAESARVRLAVFRNETNAASYIIEATPLNKEAKELNRDGWRIDLYPHARKSCDAFANLKSANYLPYVMADLYAKEHAFEECLLLNYDNNICDASKANIFLVVEGEVHTPALHQGCVNGVKRRFVIDELKNRGINVHQKEIKETDLLTANEVFLTNAINDIRWVQFYRNVEYRNDFVKSFYDEVFTTFP
ncbi:MAG TPA: aminotransferase class IV [Chitinophagaceae bacterium]|nr:aminotransferase class IV [Chitinophagaceae bacterium]